MPSPAAPAQPDSRADRDSRAYRLAQYRAARPPPQTPVRVAVQERPAPPAPPPSSPEQQDAALRELNQVAQHDVRGALERGEHREEQGEAKDRLLWLKAARDWAGSQLKGGWNNIRREEGISGILVFIFFIASLAMHYISTKQDLGATLGMYVTFSVFASFAIFRAENKLYLFLNPAAFLLSFLQILLLLLSKATELSLGPLSLGAVSPAVNVLVSLFPVWPLFLLFARTGTIWQAGQVLFIGFWLWIALPQVTQAASLNLKLNDYIPDADIGKAWTDTKTVFNRNVQAFTSGVQSLLTQWTQTAAGPYGDYGGRPKEVKPAWIRIVNIEASKPLDSTFKAGEPITLYASIIPEAISQETDAQFGCKASALVKGVAQKAEGTAEPATARIRASGKSVRCEFSPGVLEEKKVSGSFAATLYVLARNFESSAEMTSYVMDSDELAARTEKIRDENPGLTYTEVQKKILTDAGYGAGETRKFDNTPIAITFTKLADFNIVGVSDQESLNLGLQFAKSTELSLKQWNGKMQKLNSLTIELPQGMRIARQGVATSCSCSLGNTQCSVRRNSEAENKYTIQGLSWSEEEFDPEKGLRVTCPLIATRSEILGKPAPQGTVATVGVKPAVIKVMASYDFTTEATVTLKRDATSTGSGNGVVPGTGTTGGTGGAVDLTSVTGLVVPTDKELEENFGPAGSGKAQVTLKGKTAEVHAKAAGALQSVAKELEGIQNFEVHSIATYRGSDQGCEKIPGTQKCSLHSYGIAIDINADCNPMCGPCGGSGACYDPYGLCKPDKSIDTTKRSECAYRYISDEIVKAFKRNGFQWLGDWADGRDYMHFEWVGWKYSSTTDDVKKKIADAANLEGIPADIALAIARQESGINHFNSEGNAKINSACAVGIMQVIPYYKRQDGNSPYTHCSKMCSTCLQDRANTLMPGCESLQTPSGRKVGVSTMTDMEDLDTNIACGMRVLRGKYDATKNVAADYAPPGAEKCGFYYPDPWDRAIQGYVGWGCDPFHANYFTLVTQYRSEYQGYA